MINKLIVTGCLLCLQPTLSFSQSDSTPIFKNNAVYVELLGNVATSFSLNYERKVYEHKNGFFTTRAGIYFLPEIAVGTLLINHVYWKKNHHLELGAGIRLATSKEYYKDKPKWIWEKDELASTCNVMYRYQKPKGPFLFRFGWTPLVYLDLTSESEWVKPSAFLLIGTSIGYIF
jgi:hypothetical protein